MLFEISILLGVVSTIIARLGSVFSIWWGIILGEELIFWAVDKTKLERLNISCNSLSVSAIARVAPTEWASSW